MSSTQPGKEEYTYRDVRDDRVNYYFNLKKNQSKNFQLTANASYKGRYYQPAITAEAMYEGEIKATKKGLWLDIGKKRAKKMTKAEALIFSEINEKAFLYDQPDQVTTMYLIKGDRVIVNDTKIDDNQQKWYFINYKGEKELNMWIKAEAIDKAKE